MHVLWFIQSSLKLILHYLFYYKYNMYVHLSDVYVWYTDMTVKREFDIPCFIINV